MKRTAPWVGMLTLLAGCDPGKFDERPAGPDAGRDMDAASAQLDGSIDATTSPLDAAVQTPPSTDAGACIAPRGDAVRPLAVVPNSMRVLARITNPPQVAGRHAVSVVVQGGHMLWTVITTPVATQGTDGGVLQAQSYGSVGRSPLNAPWNAAPNGVTELMLDESVGSDHLPLPLVANQDPARPIAPVGAVVRDAVATLYLKQYAFVLGSYAMYTGTLQSNDDTLQAPPRLLFHKDLDQKTWGTGAFDRMDEVYAFACQYDPNDLTIFPCWVARAPETSLADAGSYEAFASPSDAGAAYGADLARATPVLTDGSELMSLSFNRHTGQWLAVQSNPVNGGDDGMLRLRSAPQPEGPWTAPIMLPLPKSALGVSGHYAVEQPDLAQNCGQRIVLSYQESVKDPFYGVAEAGNMALLSIDLQ